WPTLVRRPEASVLIRPRDAIAEFLQIQIYAHRHFAGNRKIEGPPSLGIRSGYIKRPDVGAIFVQATKRRAQIQVYPISRSHRSLPDRQLSLRCIPSPPVLYFELALALHQY